MKPRKFLPPRDNLTSEDINHETAALLLNQDATSTTRSKHIELMIEDVVNPIVHEILRKRKYYTLIPIFIYIFMTGIVLFGTFFGISFQTIGPNQIGYYANQSGYYTSGTHIQFPWNNDKFNIINTSGWLHISGKMNTDIIYDVKDINKFIHLIRHIGYNKLSNTIDNDIRKHINASDSHSLDLYLDKYGVKINQIFTSISSDTATTLKPEETINMDPNISWIEETTTTLKPEETTTTLKPEVTTTTVKSEVTTTTVKSEELDEEVTTVKSEELDEEVTTQKTNDEY